jgi:hypothetical protein
MLKSGFFGKYIANMWKALKCCAGEGWRSHGRIVRDIKVEYGVKEERNIVYAIQRRKAN